MIMTTITREKPDGRTCMRMGPEVSSDRRETGSKLSVADS
jgi:hypothetical protein